MNCYWMMSKALIFLERLKASVGSVLSFMPVAGVFTLLTVASCTSNDDFNALYQFASRTLVFSDASSMSAWLLAHSDLGHILSYALLSFTLSMVHRRPGPLPLVRSGSDSPKGQSRFFVAPCFFAPVLAGLFGLLMEAVQIFIPTRGASWGDMGSNMLGVAIGFGAYHLWALIMRERRLVALS